MKQRLITAAIGLSIFLIILFCYDTIIFDAAIAVVAIIGVHEMLLAAKITKNLPLTITAMAMPLIPIIGVRFLGTLTQTLGNHYVIIAFCVIIAIMFSIFLRYHETLKFESLATAFFAGLIVSFGFVTLVSIRNQFGHDAGMYYTLLIFACSWGADSGAYFIGRFFGKKKLAPKISPNKTVEGVLGGVIGCLLFVAILVTGYYFIMGAQGQTVEIHYLTLLIVSVVGSFVGVLGDLTASAIKRQCAVKDFGSIMPGHGGVLDRFDSVLFVSPYIYILLMFFKF